MTAHSSTAVGAADGERIAALVAELTVAEKLSLVHGTYPDDGGAGEVAGYLGPIERLDIPALRFADGPLGLRAGEATAFPASIALGASFDTELAAAFGRAVGAEARAAGVDVLLAPGCNLVRVPHCGRTFEYYGEDPHHSAAQTVATVEGIQEGGVLATPKHYVANNQEHQRVAVSAEVSERALRELYLPAFERAVREADAGAVMAAYNRVNGSYAAANRHLLTDVLKDEFGFDGPVMSDWWSVDDGPAAAAAGLDLEMPGVSLLHFVAMSDERLTFLHGLGERWPDALPGPGEAVGAAFTATGDEGGMPEPGSSVFDASLPNALADGRLPADRLDDMVRRVLTMHDRVGALDGARPTVEVDPSEHRRLARRIATAGTVLLCNDGTLPLSPDASVAVVGPNVDETKVGGGGSSEVSPRRTVSPAAGISDRAEGPVTVERGHPRIDDPSLFDPDLPLPGAGEDEPTVDAASVRAAVGDADVAVVVVQDDAVESRDRETLALPGEQDRLVSTVADAAPRTVVVLQTAGPVELPWLDAVDAVIEAWYPGQEAGHALAAVLYGDVDPGGRLPVTFAAAGDYPATATAQYPGVVGVDGYPEARYEEGVFVGYRHFDEQDVEPMFPFGHGLSYGTVSYEGMGIDGVEPTGTDHTVTVTVENDSERSCREVVQVYVSDPSASVPRPPRELAGFAAVTLSAGERRAVVVDLDDRAFAYYDEPAGEWTVEPGAFVVAAGRSSRDLPLSERIESDG